MVLVGALQIQDRSCRLQGWEVLKISSTVFTVKKYRGTGYTAVLVFVIVLTKVKHTQQSN